LLDLGFVFSNFHQTSEVFELGVRVDNLVAHCRHLLVHLQKNTEKEFQSKSFVAIKFTTQHDLY
jgi:hypothetical protein